MRDIRHIYDVCDALFAVWREHGGTRVIVYLFPKIQDLVFYSKYIVSKQGLYFPKE